MKARIDSQETLMKRLKPMLAFQAQVDSSGLDAWRETPYSDARERAALAWTEALTRVAVTRPMPCSRRRASSSVKRTSST